MGREVRRVPLDWRHPTDAAGAFVPLHDGRLLAGRLAEWEGHRAAWLRGETWDHAAGAWRPDPGTVAAHSFEDWHGPRPDPAAYAPDWPDAERAGWQLYETTTEGTPLSPACATPEALARWLVVNRVPAYGDEAVTCEEWLALVRAGSPPSLVARDGDVVSGVRALGEDGAPP